MTARLNEDDHAVLLALQGASGSLTIAALVEQTGVHQSKISELFSARAAPAGWVEVEAVERVELILSADGAVEIEPLGERRFLAVLEAAEGQSMTMQQVSAWAREAGVSVSDITKHGANKGWFDKQGGTLSLAEEGRARLAGPGDDERALEQLAAVGRLYLDELAEGIDAERAARLLNKREVSGHKIKQKPRTEQHARLLEAGAALLADPALKILKSQTQLSAEDLASGRWREIELKPYDVTLPAELRRPAKTHPLMRILQETRRAFLRLGFEEIVSAHAESAFWCFDSLFQPQDHPARDMQDTFYLAQPAEAALPDGALVDAVRRTHEDGGATGSTGWGYDWSEDTARQMVLRTHTTATTIRALAADPAPPRKVFSVGRVFRNETISYKHLPEFTQVDGVIIDAQASFRMLLGTLTEFYRQMGFDKVKFKPAFFPYTEPSTEVFVWFEPKQAWIELGGAGVFRPEVTEPLGCTDPVLAWGLGLERLAMIRYDLKDIRELYLSDLDVLRGVPLCR